MSSTFALDKSGFQWCLHLFSQREPRKLSNSDTQISLSVKWDASPVRRSVSHLVMRSVTSTHVKQAYSTRHLNHEVSACCLSASVRSHAKESSRIPLWQLELSSRSRVLEGVPYRELVFTQLFKVTLPYQLFVLVLISCSSLCRQCAFLSCECLGLSFSSGLMHIVLRCTANTRIV